MSLRSLNFKSLVIKSNTIEGLRVNPWEKRRRYDKYFMLFITITFAQNMQVKPSI